MATGTGEERHPGDVEFVHYARGTLAPGHAAAILAHCLLCAHCARRLAPHVARALLISSRGGPERTSRRSGTAGGPGGLPAKRRPPRSSSGG